MIALPPTARSITGRRVLTRASLWLVPLDLDDAEWDTAVSVLTPDERARTERGAPAVRRRRTALRAGLRAVLGEVLDCSPGEVPLRVATSGRPELCVPGRAMDVSCSASGQVGLVAVAEGLRIGVDVERVAAWTAHTPAEGWLSPRETHALVSLPPDDRAVEVTRAWTRKEAVLKATGQGLSVPAALVEPCVGQRRRARAGGWWLTPVDVPPGLVASLASSARLGSRVRHPRALHASRVDPAAAERAAAPRKEGRR